MAENEAARQTAEPIVISDSPDVCLTPMGSSVVPVPYPIVARFNDTVGVTSTVLFTDDPVFTTASDIVGVFGDEAGTLLGVSSGSHAVGGYCHVIPMAHTPVVKTEGNLVVYHSSKMAMNCPAPHGPLNTIGTVIWQQTSSSASADEEGEVEGETNPDAAPETPEERFARQPGESTQDYRQRMEDTARARPARDPLGPEMKVEELDMMEDAIRSDPDFNAWTQNIDPAQYHDPTLIPGVERDPLMNRLATGDPERMASLIKPHSMYTFAGADGYAYMGDANSVPEVPSGIKGTLALIEAQRNHWAGGAPEGTYELKDAVKDIREQQKADKTAKERRQMRTLMKGGTTIDGKAIKPGGGKLPTPDIGSMF